MSVKKKKICFLVLPTCILTVIAAVAVVMSFSSLKLVSKEALSHQNINRENSTARRQLEEAEESFKAQRTFDFCYREIDEILSLLKEVSGITVADVKGLDPEAGYTEIGEYVEGSDVKALRISIVVSDMDAALRVIGKAQFAINEITVTEPNLISIDVLTRRLDE